MKRRSIVDAVPEIADHVAAVLEGEDDSVLLGRRHAREHRGAFGHLRQRPVVHCFEVLSQDHLLHVEPHFGAHVTRHELVVTGEDLHVYAVTLEREERLFCTGERRIREGQEADENELDLVGRGVRRLGHDLARRPRARESHAC